MHWMAKLEHKIGKYAIRNLIIYILIAYGIGYVLEISESLTGIPLYSMLQMNPAAIFHGQVWRLVTWVTCIPNTSIFWAIFMFMFYYWIGRTLENVWGAFRYNVFIFFGYFMTMLGPILMYLIIGLTQSFSMANALCGFIPTDPFNMQYTCYLTSSTYYINLTSFLAFAALFPDHEVYFMFFLRVKMKWLAIIDAVFLGYEFLSNVVMAIRFYPRMALGTYDFYIYISQAVCLLFSVASFLIYYFATRNYKKISPKEIKRKRKYHKQVKEATARGTKHYCAVCGRTEVSNPELTFRFCSKCHGNLEYCNDHLFTHQHK